MSRRRTKKNRRTGPTMNKNDEIQNGQFAIEAADFLLSEIEKTLRSMLRLAKWAANTELTDRQRRILQEEIDKLKKDVDNTFAMLTDPPTLIN